MPTSILVEPLAYTRRDALRTLGSVAAASLLGCGSNATSTPATVTPVTPISPACLVESTTTRGPFFVDAINDTNNVATSGTPYAIDALIPQRSDIRSDTEGSAGTMPGVLLTLAITLYNANCSSALSGARVDMWHANAAGVYSDVQAANNGNGVSYLKQDFLRGYQVSDANGLVTFTTVFPGAYSGRCPHIHLKIRVLNASSVVTTEATTQLFFTDALASSVYTANPSYSLASYTTKDGADMIYTSESPTLLPTLTGSAAAGYNGTIAIGVAVGTIVAGN